MQPFQQRVVDEKAELDTRLGALTQFLLTPQAEKLPVDDHVLLQLQAKIMGDYSAVLERRIARF